MNKLNATDKYHSLIDDLKTMISQKDKGYPTAQVLNDQFWEDLSTHRDRMMEQIGRVETSLDDQALQAELSQADSIYEATRSYIQKYK